MFSLNGLFTFRFVTGDLSYIQTSNAIQYRPDAISTLLTGITATIVQTFLIYRYWRMSVICFQLGSQLLNENST